MLSHPRSKPRFVSFPVKTKEDRSAVNWWLLVPLALVIVLIGVTMMADSVAAQAISGDVVGTVLDKSGAAVPNAAISATNVATGVKTNTTSNGQGEFRFGNLPVGTYTIQVSASGFSTLTFSDFRVELNKVSTLAASLEIGSQSAVVEVSGATPLLNTTTAPTDTTFDPKLTTDLPVSSIGLGDLNLVLLQSCVSTSGGVVACTCPTVV